MAFLCDCGNRALVPPAPGTRMRRGWITRKGHDLCFRCWRSLRDSFRPIPPKPSHPVSIDLPEAA